MSGIEKVLDSLVYTISSNRRTGQTSALLELALANENVVVITHNEDYANSLRSSLGRRPDDPQFVSVGNLDSLRGRHGKILMFDTSSIGQISAEALKKLDQYSLALIEDQRTMKTLRERMLDQEELIKQLTNQNAALREQLNSLKDVGRGKLHHHLKTVNPFFEEVWNGNKTFELRKNDRDFRVGDEVTLIEYPVTPLNRQINFDVSYVLEHKDLPASLKEALAEDFVILGFKRIYCSADNKNYEQQQDS